MDRPYHGAVMQCGASLKSQRFLVGSAARLAAALTVAEDGGVPVILDGTLGNTDPERLRSMGAVLGRVAESCQILILTCSPERFRSLGDVRVVRLART